MKNIQLYFIYVTVQFGDEKRKYTFVTPNLKQIKDSLFNEFSTIIFPEISIKITQEIKHTISYKKDKILYELCSTKFLLLDYIKYDNNIYFEADINEKSFKNDLLIEQGEYKVNTPLEKFLKEYNIVKSYYLDKIQFKIQVVRSEYSKEFGQRNFENTYETNKIDMNIIDNEITDIHSTHIYRSNTTKKLLSIKGINDLGEKVSINYIKKEVKQKEEESFSNYQEFLIE